MRLIIAMLSINFMLVGCQSTKVIQPLKKGSVVSTLDPVDFSEKPTIVAQMLEQYKVSGFDLGSWVNQKPGQYFKLVKPQNENAAVLYVYRADSQWNRQEILAPNFFLNGKRIPSLISNHYYWIELAEGDYQLSLSRPITFVHFQKPLKANFSVKAGQQYFLKYEEEQFRGGPNGDADLLRVGPFMQMPTRQALKEIGMTQLKTPGLNYVGQVSARGEIIKPNEQIKDAAYQSYKETDDLRLKQRFKILDPRTW